MKTCYKCKVEKPLEAFHNNKSRTDGRSNECMQCCKERLEAWVIANPERSKEIKARYYAKNKAEVIERSKRQRLNNPEQQRKLKKEWELRNPEKAKANSQRNGAIRRGAKGADIVTAKEWAQVIENHGNLCFWCGDNSPNTQDHFYPLNPREGGIQGTHTVDNLVPSCKPCNLRKSNKDPLEFMLEMWTGKVVA